MKTARSISSPPIRRLFTFLRTIRGQCTDIRLDRGSTLESDSRSLRFSGSAGDGMLGEWTGITTGYSSTERPTTRVARHFSIAAPIMAGGQASDAREDIADRSEAGVRIADMKRREEDPECGLVHLAELTMEGCREDFQHGAREVSVADFTEADSEEE